MSDITYCNAKAKSSGKKCRQPVVPGSTKCRYHGGLTPRGKASPHYKNGKRSKYHPANFTEEYERALGHPELMSLRADIALVDVRIQHLLDDLSANRDAYNPNMLRAQISQFQDAYQSRDATRLASLLRQIDDGLETFVASQAGWEELFEAQAHKAKLLEAERRREVDMGAMLSMNQMLMVADRFLEMINTLVTSAEDRKRLKGAFSTFVYSNPVDVTPTSVESDAG